MDITGIRFDPNFSGDTFLSCLTYVTGCMMTINYFEEPQVCSVHSPSFRVYAVTVHTVSKRLHRLSPHLPYMYQSCVDHAWLPTE